jgi:hypothetical protein
VRVLADPEQRDVGEKTAGSGSGAEFRQLRGVRGRGLMRILQLAAHAVQV